MNECERAFRYQSKQYIQITVMYCTHHDPVSRVVMRWTGVATVAKVRRDAFNRALVHDTPFVKEDQSVKGGKERRRRLMGGKQNRRSGIGHLLEHLAQPHSTKGIQTTCRLIEEEKVWLDDKLHTNGSALRSPTEMPFLRCPPTFVSAQSNTARAP